MKRLASSLILACLALSGVAAIEAKVVSVSGKAERQKGSEWVALAAGDVLKAGAVIQTGFKSQLVLNIKSANEDSTLTVAPLSRMTIEQLSEKGNQDTTSVFLDSGSLKSSIKKTEDRRANYQVRTSVATASVRGTVIKTGVGYRSMSMITLDGTAECIPQSNQKPVILSSDTSEVAPLETAAPIDSSEGAAGDAAGAGAPAPIVSTPAPAQNNSFGTPSRGGYYVTAGQETNLNAGGSYITPNAKFSNQALAFKTTANAGPVAEIVHIAEVPPATSFTHHSVQDGQMPSGSGGKESAPTTNASSGGSSGGVSGGSSTVNISVGNWGN